MQYQPLPISKVFWLASYPKSGNTWVRMFLQSYLNLYNDPNRRSLVLGDNDQVIWQRICPRPMHMMHPMHCLMLREAFVMHASVTCQYDRCILKTHHCAYPTENFQTIPKRLTGGAVYLVRDPRDVAISLNEHMGQEDLDETIKFMDTPSAMIGFQDGPLGHVLNCWSTHVNSWCSSGIPVTLVQYEHLLENPVKHFTRILEAFGYPVCEERLEAAIMMTAFDRLKQAEDNHTFYESSKKTDRFFKRGTSGHWRDVLSAEQSGKIETQHRGVMQRLGYLEEQEDGESNYSQQCVGQGTG